MKRFAYTFASKLKFSFQILWTSERVIFFFFFFFFARWKNVLLVRYFIFWAKLFAFWAKRCGRNSLWAKLAIFKCSMTCTSVPCKWLMPTPVIAISYQELRDIAFTSSKTKKRKLDSEISGLSSDPPKQNASPAQFDTAKNVYVPSQADIKKFFESLNASNTHPAILPLIPPYNIKY